MTLSYKLNETDYLIFLLFQASSTQRTKDQRSRNLVFGSLGLLALGLIFYLSNNMKMTYYFLFCFVLYILCFPLYSKWFYKNHYKRYVIDTYKNRFDKPATLILENDHILTSDFTGEGKINLSELEKVTETGDYFFMKFKFGESLIIPKSKVNDTNSVREKLEEICKFQNTQFISNLNWKWK